MKKRSMKPQGFFRVCLAQINTTVGDFSSNREKIIRALKFAHGHKAHLTVFPELTIPGYPPEDLLLRKGFISENQRILREILPHTGGIAAILGYVDRDPKSGDLYNAAALASGKKLLAVYRKNRLPNYGVFDEKRYFKESDKPLIAEVAGVRVGISVCEDIWDRTSFIYQKSYAGQAQVLVNISASPYHRDKQTERMKLFRQIGAATKAWLVYQNLVGGQDELVFDGGSMVTDPKGNPVAEAGLFEEKLVLADIPVDALPGASKAALRPVRTNLSAPLIAKGDRIAPVKHKPRGREEEVYAALCLGTADYARKNGFKKTVLGLSGGIDSALVAAIAVDALGAENVIAVTMPSPYTSEETYQDSRHLAKSLGIRCLEFRIDSLFAEYKRVLESVFGGHPENIAEENLQARIRGNLLMALSNKFGYLVLTTGNKSETATGYCTLYGDMAGGLAVIKDVPKTLVFKLARWLNGRSGPVIPESILRRAPTAELRHGQRDQDSLPPYELLDPVIEAYVQNNTQVEKISVPGMTREDVLRVVSLIDSNEYKRRQAPPGIKITPRAFGRDRRMPITNRYREGVGR